MNPTDLAESVRLLAERMFRLPTVVPRELLDGISFEDTEAALSRQLGEYLPAPAVRHSVADDRGGAFPEPTRTGDPRLVRSDLPHIDRTGRAPAARPEASEPPQPGPAGATAAGPVRKVPGVTGQDSPGQTGDAPRGVAEWEESGRVGGVNQDGRVSGGDQGGWAGQVDGVGRGNRVGRVDRVGGLDRAGGMDQIGQIGQVPDGSGQAGQNKPVIAGWAWTPGHPNRPQWTDVPAGTEVTLLERSASALSAVLGATPEIDQPVEPELDAVLRQLRDQLELEFHRAYGGW